MCHSSMNSSMGPNRRRSANDPQMSAAVVIANVSWYAQYTDSGMVGASWCTLAGVRLSSSALLRSPTTEGGRARGEAGHSAIE